MSRARAQRAARKIFQRVAKRRLPSAPRAQLIGAAYDPTYRTFEIEDRAYQIIGADAPAGQFPLFDAARARFPRHECTKRNPLHVSAHLCFKALHLGSHKNL